MQVNSISFGKSSIRNLRPENEKKTEQNKVLKTSMDYILLINEKVLEMSKENDFDKRYDIRQDVNLLLDKIFYNLNNIKNSNRSK